MFWHTRQKPPENLPVAPDPAVPTPRVSQVAGRVILMEHHVALQAGAAVAAFEQIVAEDCLLWKYAAATLEGVYIVDAFANEGALIEEILIEIGDNPCVGIDARTTSGDPAKPRSPRARQAHAHPWLEDAVPRHNPGQRGMEQRSIEDVCHRANHLTGSVTREISIGVERDHEDDPGQKGGVADHEGEGACRPGESSAAENGV